LCAVDRTLGDTAEWCRQCRIQGRGIFGRLICRFGEKSCRFPAPLLSPADALTLLLLRRSAHQWNIVFGPFGQAVRTGLNYSGVRAVAEWSSIEITPFLRERLQAAESLLVIQDARRAKASRKE
jgi:hypothetical protein